MWRTAPRISIWSSPRPPTPASDQAGKLFKDLTVVVIPSISVVRAAGPEPNRTTMIVLVEAEVWSSSSPRRAARAPGRGHQRPSDRAEEHGGGFRG